MLTRDRAVESEESNETVGMIDYKQMEKPLLSFSPLGVSSNIVNTENSSIRM